MTKPKRKKKRSLDEGLWLITEDNKYIPVKKKVLKPESITPQPIIRYGKPHEEGRPIELVDNAQWPLFKPNITELIRQAFTDEGVTAGKIWPKSDIAETKMTNFINAVLLKAGTIPLESYETGKVDRKLNRVEVVEKYEVVGVNETTSREQLKPFPYLTVTHQIHERDDKALWVWPRIYWDLWLTDKIYQLTAYDDVGRFELWKLAQRLNSYPFPRKTAKGKPVMKKGEPVIDLEEAMLVHQGYVAQTGSTKQYHAMIAPERIISKKEEKFVFLMKLSRAVTRYADAMKVPLEGEVPITVTAEQKPVVIEAFADMLKAVVA